MKSTSDKFIFGLAASIFSYVTFLNSISVEKIKSYLSVSLNKENYKSLEILKNK